jgi:hypothetical protein
MTIYNSGSCIICLEDFDNMSKTHSLPCGHTFHVECIIKCFRKTNECPYCRDTDGNPKVSSNTNMNGFVWDNDDSWETIDEDYNEFEKFFKDLKKKDINIKEKANEFNDLKKNINKFTNKLYLTFSNERKKNDQIFLQKFKEENEELKEYNELIKNYKNKRKSLFIKYRNEIKNRLNIDIDNDIKTYINDYLDSTGIGITDIFEIPNIRSRYEYLY